MTELPDRFVSKFVATANGCWQWTGKLREKGYGVFWVAGKHVRAHRFAYTALGHRPREHHARREPGGPPSSPDALPQRA